jgi:hypothetical protein
MTKEKLVQQLVALGIDEIHRLLDQAAQTRYRSQVTDRMARLITGMDTARGVAPSMSRTRALLLLPATPVEPTADEAAVRAYVRAVALGAPGAELAAAVTKTVSPALMRRFLRYAAGVDRTDVREMYAVTLVMDS